MNRLNVCLTTILFSLSFNVLAQTEFRLLLIGNSITWHTPNTALEWTGNWGMAATKQENDYVHVLAKLVQTANPAAAVSSYPRNLSDFEGSPATFDLERFGIVDSFKPTHIIVFFGDNVHAPQTTAFSTGYISALDRLTRNAAAQMFCVSTWWPNKTVDAIIAEGCESKGGTFVDISSLSKMPGFRADTGDFKSAGVSAHPSDLGMRAIAAAIFEKFQK
jgi:alpha-galactosidase